MYDLIDFGTICFKKSRSNIIDNQPLKTIQLKNEHNFNKKLDLK